MAFARLFARLELAAGEFSVTVLDDAAIRRMNREHLDHDWVPDVLSFALHEPDRPTIADIYVGLDQAARQAAEHGVPLEEELARLALHGALHTLGHDHPDDPVEREDSPMYRLQEEILSELPPASGSPGDPEVVR
ncbi:MAG: rRNA maturation RNase YbeY [Gemmatimonadales bacterium]|nr:MAG: rRNA maturation RNase YbeY [Gemmatimonadales bacterium]